MDDDVLWLVTVHWRVDFPPSEWTFGPDQLLTLGRLVDGVRLSAERIVIQRLELVDEEVA